MTSEPGSPTGRARDLRTRRAWTITGLVTLVAGGGLAALAAIGGADGRAGAASFLVGTALAATIGSMYAFVTGLRDTMAGDRVPAPRAVTAAFLGFLALVLIAGTAGMVSTSG